MIAYSYAQLRSRPTPWTRQALTSFSFWCLKKPICAHYLVMYRHATNMHTYMGPCTASGPLIEQPAAPVSAPH